MILKDKKRDSSNTRALKSDYSNAMPPSPNITFCKEHSTVIASIKNYKT